MDPAKCLLMNISLKENTTPSFSEGQQKWGTQAVTSVRSLWMSPPASTVPRKRLRFHLRFPQAACDLSWLAQASCAAAANLIALCWNLPGCFRAPLRLVGTRVAPVTAHPILPFGPCGYYLTDQKVFTVSRGSGWRGLVGVVALPSMQRPTDGWDLCPVHLLLQGSNQSSTGIRLNLNKGMLCPKWRKSRKTVTLDWGTLTQPHLLTVSFLTAEQSKWSWEQWELRALA